LEPGTARTLWWLWPNLLSLDAPLIAALWQNLFAAASGVSLSPASRVALPLAVWVIYLIDRLLDTAHGMHAQLAARHNFYCVYRGLCYVLTCGASCLLITSVFYLPAAVFKNGLFTSCVVALYLLVVHRHGWRRWLPKEAVVGLVFAVGSVLAPFTRTLHPEPLFVPALIFGFLCWMNSSAIEVWEGGSVDSVSAWLVSHMKIVTAMVCLCCLLVSSRNLARALFIASLGLWIVTDRHRKLSAPALRVWVDIPLLAPLLMLSL